MRKLLFTLFFMLLAPLLASAQTYPDRTITMIVPSRRAARPIRSRGSSAR